MPFGGFGSGCVLKGLIAPIFLSGLLLSGPAVLGGCTSAVATAPKLANQDAGPLKSLLVPYSFVVVGDNRSGEKVYRAIVEDIAELKPDFVINTGDAISSPGSIGEWAEFTRLSSPLTMPYFIVPGNHDVDDAESEAAFRQFVDQPAEELYYSFDAGGSLYVVLDSEEPDKTSRITGGQLEWLKGELARPGYMFKFVFVHRPLYPDEDIGMHEGGSLDRYEEDRDALQRLFEQSGVDAVFAGHEHLYMRKRVGPVMHIITGGAGAMLYARGSKGGFHHFVKVEVKKDAAVVSVIDLKGAVRDVFEIIKEETG